MGTGVPSARILVVSPEAPAPLDRGFRLRVHHLLAALARAGDRVTVLAPRSASSDRGLEELGVEVLHCPTRDLPGGRTGWVPRVRDVVAGRPPGTLTAAALDLRPVLGRLLRERPFDAVQVELPSLVDVPVSRGIPTVLDAHNLWYELTRRRQALVRSAPRRLAGTAVAWRQRTVERGAWRAADLCLATSEREREVIAVAGVRRTALVPNGVDTGAVRPCDGPAEQPPRLVFVGLMGYRPNADAVTHLVRDVLPVVHRSRPEVRVRIVGDGVPSDLARLAGPSVEFTGGVPDVRPHLAGAAVVVTPLRVGSGTRLKILEALAMGRPVVSTSTGAEGLGLVDGVHALIADDPGALAAAVLRVLEQPALAASLGRAGRALVESEYAWTRIGERLRTAYDELLGTP